MQLPDFRAMRRQALGEGIAVRASKNPDFPALRYTREELAAFIAGAKAGEFDHLI